MTDLKPSYIHAPGSGTYDIPSMLIESSGKTFSKKLVTQSLKGELGNGPAMYSVDKPRKNDLRFSMAGRLEDLEFRKRNFAPGPGNYDLQNTQNKNHVNPLRFSFGGEKRLRDISAKE